MPISRIIGINCLIITSLLLVSSLAFASGGGGGKKEAPKGGEAAEGESTEEGGGATAPPTLKNVKGGGTEPVYFDDNTLIKDPTPIATPITKTSVNQVNVWDVVHDSKLLLIRVETDLPRYEKKMRETMDAKLLEMDKLTASMHTYAVLNERDKIETIWQQQAEETIREINVFRGQVDEMHEDYVSILENQEAAAKILKKGDSSIQMLEEIKAKFEQNEKRLYFAKKGIDKFTDLFNRYIEQFNKVSERKEGKAAKLIEEHEELHRP